MPRRRLNVSTDAVSENVQALEDAFGVRLLSRITQRVEGVAAGVPGATLSKALVSSDRAQVAWSATVAVRNEVVSAYQTIMNMQF